MQATNNKTLNEHAGGSSRVVILIHVCFVSKQITRKVIRKLVSADGVEREEVLMMEGPQQEAVRVDEADSFSKVLKRTVVRSAGDQTQVCL